MARRTKSSPAAGAVASDASGFSPEEQAAMRERAQEMQVARRHRVDGGAADAHAVVAAIAAMPQPDRTIGERIHALVTTHAPSLAPRLWYGMPSYAKDGKPVCFFQSAQKFKTRYCTLGFSDRAHLDDGRMWPSAFAVLEMTAAEEARIVALLAQALT